MYSWDNSKTSRWHRLEEGFDQGIAYWYQSPDKID